MIDEDAIEDGEDFKEEEDKNEEEETFYYDKALYAADDLDEEVDFEWLC